eukprot:6481817-Amphidinium_carterae.1
MQQHFQKFVQQHRWGGALALAKERAIYNFYLHVLSGVAERSLSAQTRWRWTWRKALGRRHCSKSSAGHR